MLERKILFREGPRVRVIINCYHKNIKDSLIAHLTLVGHNDIINDFKILAVELSELKPAF